MKTKLELVVEILVKDLQEDLNGHYKNWEIESWSEMLNAFGQDSKDCKEDLIYILDSYANDNNIFPLVFDDGSLEDTDGTIVSYRKIVNLVKKELFKKEEKDYE